MSAVVTVLAAIGLIVVISYLIYYLYEYIKYRMDRKIAENTNPPNNYMQNSKKLLYDIGFQQNSN